ncbi:MAG TPA: hypothetical protein VGM06_16690 [Polyangiaceae bacterium]
MPILFTGLVEVGTRGSDVSLSNGLRVLGGLLGVLDRIGSLLLCALFALKLGCARFLASTERREQESAESPRRDISNHELPPFFRRVSPRVRDEAR